MNGKGIILMLHLHRHFYLPSIHAVLIQQTCEMHLRKITANAKLTIEFPARSFVAGKCEMRYFRHKFGMLVMEMMMMM